jgi:hypothetical protein
METAAARASTPSPASRLLYRQVLQLIFAHLDFSGLHASLRVCRLWRSSLSSMRGSSSGGRFCLLSPSKSLAHFELAARSPLARHVSSIFLDGLSERSEISFAHLLRASPSFAYLRELRWKCMRDEGEAAGAASLMAATAAAPSVVNAFVYPAELRLPIDLAQVTLNLIDVSSAVPVMAILPKLAELRWLWKLRLSFARIPTDVSFASMCHAPALWDLFVENQYNVSFTPQQLYDLRQLTTVGKLEVNPFAAENFLAMLQAPGPQLRWTCLPRHVPVYESLASRLVLLPCLTEVTLALDGIHDLSFLPRLTHLHTLHLTGNQFHVAAGEAQLATLTAPMPHVKELSVRCCKLTTPQLHAFLSLTPCLERLSLSMLRDFDALTFLAPVQSTLRSLTLASCNGPSFLPVHLRFLRELPHLTDVQLHSSPGQPLSASDQKALAALRWSRANWASGSDHGWKW